MKEALVLEILGQVGAVITGSHIVYTSGKHGTAHVNKDAIYPYTRLTSVLCRALAEMFCIMEEVVQVVVGPALGGIILTQWTAHHLSYFQGNEVLAVYAEKDTDGTFAFTRNYDKLVAGKRVLIVEDVLTTGGSVKKVVELVRSVGGIVVGVGALCNRGGVRKADIDVRRFEALTNLNLESWEETDCPLCRDRVPVNIEVGKGKEFLARVITGG